MGKNSRSTLHTPFGQILFDNVFFLLFVGLAIPFLSYTVWGLLNVGSVPFSPSVSSQTPMQETPPHGEASGAGMPGMPQAPASAPPNAQRVEVVAAEFAFAPADITVQAGRPVAVTVVNRGTVAHDWAVRTLSREDISGTMADTRPGGQAMVVFTLKPGEYEVWCTVPGHYQAGMKGRLIVR